MDRRTQLLSAFSFASEQKSDEALKGHSLSVIFQPHLTIYLFSKFIVHLKNRRCFGLGLE